MTQSNSMPQRLMKHLKIFEMEFFAEWGFCSLREYAGAALGLKVFPFFKLHLLGTVAGAVLAFFAEWIWNPPGAGFLIMGATLVNAYYGYQVSKHIKGEGWSWKKFRKTRSILVSDLVLMSLLHLTIHFYSYYSVLADVLFGWLMSHKLRAIAHHMILLKWQQGGIADYLKKYFLKVLNQKIGADIVDNIQEKKDGNNRDIN